MNSIAAHIKIVKQRIHKAALASGRNSAEIKLLCVSKYATIDNIKTAIIAGETAFAENYVQNALQKMERLDDKGLTWHFIGNIQRNKTRKIAQHFSWVHSVASERIAQQLNEHRGDKAPLNVCIQVNVDADKSKAGVSIEKSKSLATFVAQLPKLKLRGLMTILKKYANLEDAKNSYRQVNILYQQLQRDGFTLDTLSAGMSADMEAAIAEGATMVRIGNAIFGETDKVE